MLISKNNMTMCLDNPDHLNAFLSSGWEEVKASPQSVKEEPKVEPKEEKIARPRRKKQEN